MDRVSNNSNHPGFGLRSLSLSLSLSLFNPFSKLRRPESRSSANLDRSDSQPSLRDSNLKRQVLTQTL
jgi:hypothetical protein